MNEIPYRSEDQKDKLYNAAYEADKLRYVIKNVDHDGTIEDHIKQILDSEHYTEKMLHHFIHKHKKIEKNWISETLWDIYIKDKEYQKHIEAKNGFDEMNQLFHLQDIYKKLGRKNCMDFFKYQVWGNFNYVKSDIKIKHINELYIFLEDTLKARIETVFFLVEKGIKNPTDPIKLATSVTKDELWFRINWKKVINIKINSEPYAQVAYHIISSIHSQEKIETEIHDKIRDSDIKELMDNSQTREWKYFSIDEDF